MAFNDIRKKTPCRFSDGFSQQEFETLALTLMKKIKRIKNIRFDGAIIHCTVESQTHISEWDFSVDFNDWGHITGVFWTDSENYDSSIPNNFGMTLSGWIQTALNREGIEIREMSDDVDAYENLDQLINSGIHCNRGLFQYFVDEILGNKKKLAVNYADCNMSGEHLYPVFAQLMNNGFGNISVRELKDADGTNRHYEYEVAQVSIGGKTSFKKGDFFYYNEDVVITYHAKREIEIPFLVRSLIYQNYIIAGDRLQELGFTNIYEREIKDLVLGLIIKDGSTDRVVIIEDDGSESPVQNGKAYPYDTEIVVCYHTHK